MENTTTSLFDKMDEEFERREVLYAAIRILFRYVENEFGVKMQKRIAENYKQNMEKLELEKLTMEESK